MSAAVKGRSCSAGVAGTESVTYVQPTCLRRGRRQARVGPASGHGLRSCPMGRHPRYRAAGSFPAPLQAGQLASEGTQWNGWSPVQWSSGPENGKTKHVLMIYRAFMIPDLGALAHALFASRTRTFILSGFGKRRPIGGQGSGFTTAFLVRHPRLYATAPNPETGPPKSVLAKSYSISAG